MIPAQEEGVPESRLDKTIRLLTDTGMSRELILSQLLTAGHPIDALRARFPDSPDTAFQQTQPRRLQMDKLRPLARIPAQENRVVVSTIAKPTELTPSPATKLEPSAPSYSPQTTDLPNDGISFQYVPLIQ